MSDTDEKVLCVTLNGYQEMAAATAIYPQDRAIEYLALGMASEAGEVAGKVKKMIRDGGYFNEQLADETGDVLWYVSEMARQLGVTLEELASRNLRKLQSRQSRGVLGGSGDVR